MKKILDLEYSSDYANDTLLKRRGNITVLIHSFNNDDGIECHIINGDPLMDMYGIDEAIEFKSGRIPQDCDNLFVDDYTLSSLIAFSGVLHKLNDRVVSESVEQRLIEMVGSGNFADIPQTTIDRIVEQVKNEEYFNTGEWSTPEIDRAIMRICFGKED